MKTITSALILSSGLLVSLGAQAVEPGYYLGGGYAPLTLDSNDVSSNAHLDALFVRGGVQFNENLAAEVRIGTGIQDDRVDGTKVELEDMYGIYLKAGLPTTVGLYPYALLGATHAKIKLSNNGLHSSTSDSDISYGLGIEYEINYAATAGLEWANLYDKNGDTITGVTLGLNFRFQ